jgi:hypothetical protein
MLQSANFKTSIFKNEFSHYGGNQGGNVNQQRPMIRCDSIQNV